MLMPNYYFANEFSEFDYLLKSRFKTKVHVEKGTTIIHPGDTRKEYYYVVCGKATFILRHEDGGAKASSVRAAGSIFPLFYTYSSTSVESILEVRAQTAMDLLVIPRDDLHKLMLEFPEIAIAMCNAYGKYTTLLLHDSADTQFESARIRVCNFLALRALASGDVLTATHDCISEFTGITRATVSRILSDLNQQGIISTGRQKIEILSRELLLAECSYAINQP